MSSRLLIVTLVLLLALSGCDSGGAPEAERQTPPPEAVEAGMDGETVPLPDEPEAAGETPAEPKTAETDQPASRNEVPAVVATVNGSPISGQFLEGQLAMAEADSFFLGELADLSDEERAEADLRRRLEALSNLISLELACQEALGLGYAPSDEEVEKELAELKKNYEGQPESLEQIMGQYGLVEDDLRGQIRKTLALKKWRENNFLAQIKVSDEEARAFYDQNRDSFRHGDLLRVSQIFLPLPLVGTPAQIEKARTEAQAKGEMAFKLINSGVDFGTVAVELSKDRDVEKSRGDLGWIEKGQALPGFEPAVFDMEPGQVSEILETPLGLYIFKITEAKPAGLEPFESFRADLIEFLSEEKLDKVLRGKMFELFQKADIQIFDPKLKEVYEALPQAGLAADPAGETADEPAGETADEPALEPHTP